MDSLDVEPIPGDPPLVRITLSEGDLSLSKDLPLEEAEDFGRRVVTMARRRRSDFKKGH